MTDIDDSFIDAVTYTAAQFANDPSPDAAWWLIVSVMNYIEAENRCRTNAISETAASDGTALGDSISRIRSDADVARQRTIAAAMQVALTGKSIASGLGDRLDVGLTSAASELQRAGLDMARATAAATVLSIGADTGTRKRVTAALRGKPDPSGEQA